MAQASFAERLERIERTQHAPLKDRMLVGLSDVQIEQETHPSKRKGKKIRSKKRRLGPEVPLRFLAGFTLMFTCFLVLAEMDTIQTLVDSTPVIADFSQYTMIGIAGAVVATMLYFAFKLQRAAFRVMREPGRLPLAIGMVLGFAIGFEPVQFSDTMMEQVAQVAEVAQLQY